ncbi:ryncolin-2-like [Diadema setosum]|uniref:ryncolin-2-like n=1 Tax=Diadema setosum TaxID=31175 RepID=UPI003B3B0386
MAIVQTVATILLACILVNVQATYNFTDCGEIRNHGQGVETSGMFPIHLVNGSSLDVFCDMTSGGGGWMVIQRRKDGVVDFNLDWASYKAGFGDPTGEFWLGNDNIHAIVSGKSYEVRFDLEDHAGETRYAVYTTFDVADESDKYRLTISGYYGDAGNSMDYHNGMQFSTSDQDNDLAGWVCAIAHKGAWWYNACQSVNLNGLYGAGVTVASDGIVWRAWHELLYSLKGSEIKIRPRV